MDQAVSLAILRARAQARAALAPHLDVGGISARITFDDVHSYFNFDFGCFYGAGGESFACWPVSWDFNPAACSADHLTCICRYLASRGSLDVDAACELAFGAVVDPLTRRQDFLMSFFIRSRHLLADVADLAAEFCVNFPEAITDYTNSDLVDLFEATGFSALDVTCEHARAAADAALELYLFGDLREPSDYTIDEIFALASAHESRTFYERAVAALPHWLLPNDDDDSGYFSWADEIHFWTWSSPAGWYEACLEDPTLINFLQLLREPSATASAYPIDMTSLRDTEIRYLSQAGANRVFIPRPFVAAPMYNALGLPWFLDYVHLAFCFFFFGLFVLVMWIVLASFVFSKNVEARQPMRETRGFSRAQTGDGITAVLPMTWSITMLMHASTHSVNFDENTAGTTFTFTVVAYQWGWNYYFPRDVVSLCWSLPKQVGRGATVDLAASGQHYRTLLGYARRSTLGMLTNEFRFASKVGRGQAANVLSLFLKPTAFAADAGLPAFYALSTFQGGARGGVLAGRKILLQTHTAAAAQLVEAADESGLGVAAASRGVNAGNLTAGLSLFGRFFWREHMLRHNAQSALRARDTYVVSSNRLMLIHEAAAACRGIFDAAALRGVREFSHSGALRQLRAAGAAASTAPRDLDFSYHTRSLHCLEPAGLGVNTWLLFFCAERYLSAHAGRWLQPAATQNFWSSVDLARRAEFFTAMPCAQQSASVILANARYAGGRRGVTQILAPSAPLSAAAAALLPRLVTGGGAAGDTLNIPFLTQLFTHTAADSTFLFSFASLLTYDDLGLNYSPAVKEMANRLVGYGVYSRTLQILSSECTDCSGWALHRVWRGGISPVYFDSAIRRAATLFAAAPRDSALSRPRGYAPLPSFGQCGGGTSLSALSAEASSCALTGALTPLSLQSAVTAARGSTISVLTAIATAHRAYSTALAQAAVLSAPTLLPLALRSQFGLEQQWGSTRVAVRNASTVGYRAVAPLITPSYESVAACRIVPAALLHPTAAGLLSPDHRVSVAACALFSQPAPEPSSSATFGDYPMRSRPTPSTAISATAYFPAPLWWDSVDAARPVRLNAAKQVNPSLFCAKLGDLPTNQVRFSHKGLFDWSFGWSAQTQLHGLPLYRLYRGALVRKPGHCFWLLSPEVARSASAAVTAAGAWHQPFKNVDGLFFFSPRPRGWRPTVDAPFTQPTLDRSLVHAVKTRVAALPTIHEEFDINFTYRYWAPEINTTRRADHGSRFRTTWSSAFAATAQLAQRSILADSGRDTTLGRGFYVSTNQGGAGEYFSPAAADVFPPRFDASALLRGRRLFAAGPLDYLIALRRLGGVCPRTSLVPQTTCLLARGGTAPAVRGELWTRLWAAADMLPSYKVSDTVAHGASTPRAGAWTLKFTLIAADVDRFFRGMERAGILATTADVRSLRLSSLGRTITEQSSVVQRLGIAITASRERSAYEFVRCDVGSMRRLRVTKGVCLPADYPIHVVCGSKDVVHSWAIPGLGVKIDCIPGYNSHRRVVFRWRGIYWGQCMEVCGRYHHWMPILVRIVHRDVFLSWCLIYLRSLNSRTPTLRQQRQSTLAVVDWLRLSPEAVVSELQLAAAPRHIAAATGLVRF